MNPLFIFALGALTGGLVFAIHVSFNFKRIRAKLSDEFERYYESKAKAVYIDGYNEGHDVGACGTPNPWKHQA